MAHQVSGASLKRQVLFWAGVFVVLVLFLWFFRSILLPFVAGMALAYFLDPVADWLERRGLSRIMATVVILIAFVLVFVLSLMLLIPIAVSQFAQFAEALPGYVAQLQQLLANPETSILPGWVTRQIEAVKQNFSDVLGQGAQFIGALIKQIWDSGKAIVDVISLLVITPVVAFYLLYDWDRMTATIDGWIPRDQVATIRGIAREMDEAVAGFIRGQGSLCLVLGIFHAVGLSMVGLNFGLLIGLMSGFLSFIPYVGTAVSLILGVGIAIMQFWPDYIWILAVGAVFAAGQFLEVNILQPKMVGDSVGLHPVWLMFSLLAFGTMFGFLGLLIAVPAAAMIKVLIRFALKQYLESDLYYGRDGEALPEAAPAAPRVDDGDGHP